MNLTKKALTFDDILLVPAHSTVLPKEVDLSTKLTKNIRLQTPILSAAMDTVTEANLAIAIAQEGVLVLFIKTCLQNLRQMRSERLNALNLEL